MDFLVFQLYGPLASWGDIAVGEIRPTQDRPSQSALAGLLAAAFGVKRDEEAKLVQISRQYGTAFCVLQAGEEMRDYHTVQVPKTKKGEHYNSRCEELSAPKLETLLSYRDYRTDALYLTAIWIKENQALFSLKEIKRALRSPKFPLYLGRKSCPPGLPLAPEIFADISLKQAFDKYPVEKAKDWVDKLKSSQEESQLIQYFWEDGVFSTKEAGMEPDMIYPRHDRLISRKRQQFSKRDECYYSESAGNRQRNSSANKN